MGAAHVTMAWVFDLSMLTSVGAAGTDAGMYAGELAEATEFPARFVATALKTYEVPFVRSLTKHVSGPDVQVQLFESGVEVIV